MKKVIAEGLTLGVSAGVELQALQESGSRGVLGQRSAILSQTVFRGQFEPPTFPLAGSRKDIGLATELGREYNVPTPMANLAEQIMIQGINRGWADKDYNITFLPQEEATGVQVRGSERLGRVELPHPVKLRVAFRRRTHAKYVPTLSCVRLFSTSPFYMEREIATWNEWNVDAIEKLENTSLYGQRAVGPSISAEDTVGPFRFQRAQTPSGWNA